MVDLQAEIVAIDGLLSSFLSSDSRVVNLEVKKKDIYCEISCLINLRIFVPKSVEVRHFSL